MRSLYNRLELALGAAGLLTAAAVLAVDPSGRDVPVPELFRYAGVLLLAQSFVRDVYLLTSRRAEPRSEGAGTQGWFICVESVLGLALVGQGLFLSALEVRTTLSLPVGAWGLGVSLWWLVGYAIRELVFELRRDPDHLNLLVGPRASRTAPRPGAPLSP
jgi:hypothetical protein